MNNHEYVLKKRVLYILQVLQVVPKRFKLSLLFCMLEINKQGKLQRHKTNVRNKIILIIY